ncbi:hypothetical protein TCAL_04852, partial [Tigriopus californicus]|eukprot:TCALIF_04852-PA protein Name:"Protein of unknown function" AED:0.37 eAED:0.37 QI:2/0/0/0.33/0/0/6/0/425
MEYYLLVNRSQKMEFRAANDDVMNCEGLVKLTCTVAHSGNSANVILLVSKDISREILLSYGVLTMLKVLPSDFPFAKCKKVDSTPEEYTDMKNHLVAKFSGMRLSSYNCHVSWVEGKVHLAADALSRYPIFSAQEEDEENSQAFAKRVNISDPRLARIVESANDDENYQEMVATLEKGIGPKAINNDRRPSKLLSGVWNELSTFNTPKGKLIAMNDRPIGEKEDEKEGKKECEKEGELNERLDKNVENAVEEDDANMTLINPVINSDPGARRSGGFSVSLVDGPQGERSMFALWAAIAFLPFDTLAEDEDDCNDRDQDDYGVILANAWVVVPLTAQRMILDALHQSDQGVTKLRAAARVGYFWSGMNIKIALRIQQCWLCQEIRPSQPMELMQKSEFIRPFECLSMDLFQAAGKDYMVFVGRLSN